jgi:hypothetical protein
MKYIIVVIMLGIGYAVPKNTVLAAAWCIGF